MHLRGALSLKKKLAKNFEPKLLELIIFGQMGSETLGIEATTLQAVQKSTRGEISSMKKTCASHYSVSLSAPQLGLSPKISVINQNLQKTKQWIGMQFSVEQDFISYINPKILQVSKDTDRDWEFCLTFPMIKVKALRYNEILVRYYNEEMEEIEEKMDGFKARIFQHELDHLNGKDFLDWRVNSGNIELIETIAHQFPRFQKVIQEYGVKVKQMQEEFPEYNKPRPLTDLNKAIVYRNKPSWENDINQRLLKQCQKDLQFWQQHVQNQSDGSKQKSVMDQQLKSKNGKI